MNKMKKLILFLLLTSIFAVLISCTPTKQVCSAYGEHQRYQHSWNELLLH
jgi:hypothetical protein